MKYSEQEYMELLNYYNEVKNSNLYKEDLEYYISLMLDLEILLRQYKENEEK